jgi:hypothetical protein
MDKSTPAGSINWCQWLWSLCSICCSVTSFSYPYLVQLFSSFIWVNRCIFNVLKIFIPVISHLSTNKKTGLFAGLFYFFSQ